MFCRIILARFSLLGHVLSWQRGRLTPKFSYSIMSCWVVYSRVVFGSEKNNMKLYRVFVLMYRVVSGPNTTQKHELPLLSSNLRTTCVSTQYGSHVRRNHFPCYGITCLGRLERGVYVGVSVREGRGDPILYLISIISEGLCLTMEILPADMQVRCAVQPKQKIRFIDRWDDANNTCICLLVKEYYVISQHLPWQ